MIFFLDTNVLADANRDYYPIDRVPEFWDWLIYHGVNGNIKIPEEIIEEISAGNDQLAQWIKQREVKKALMLEEEVDSALFQQVMDEGYGQDLTDIEIQTIGRDPFLITYALADPQTRTIVTSENSSPSKQRANRKIPDICTQFHIQCIKKYDLIQSLDFSTDWKNKVSK